MTRTTYVYSLSLMTVGLGVAPPLAGWLLGASSAALGLFLAASLSLFSSLKYYKYVLKIERKTLLFFYVFTCHFFLAQVFQSAAINWRAFASIFLIIFLILMAKALAIKLVKIWRDDYTFHVTRLACIIFTVIFLLNYYYDFMLARDLYLANRSVFPFGEPSHFALFVGPFYVLLGILCKSLNGQMTVLILMAAIGFGLQSTTFLIYGILLLILIIFEKLSFKSGFVSAIFLLGVSLLDNTDYYIQRMYISSDSDNLSSLVYLQGLQDAWRALSDTFGFGLGFQMLGMQPPSDVSYLIAKILGVPVDVGLNRLDGGFLGAKIVSEFGVFGLILIALYVFRVVEAFKFLASGNVSQAPTRYAVYSVFLYCSLVEFFIRGMGYFSPSIYILAVLFFSRSIEKQRFSRKV